MVNPVETLQAIADKEVAAYNNKTSRRIARALNEALGGTLRFVVLGVTAILSFGLGYAHGKPVVLFSIMKERPGRQPFQIFTFKYVCFDRIFVVMDKEFQHEHPQCDECEKALQEARELQERIMKKAHEEMSRVANQVKQEKDGESSSTEGALLQW